VSVSGAASDGGAGETARGGNGHERTVTIQPGELPDRVLPYPYHINPDGTVGRQDIWKGRPAVLAGFQARRETIAVDLEFPQFWANPSLAVGMYPVVMNADGSMDTLLNPIDAVRVSAGDGLGGEEREAGTGCDR
jgi:hypothetical protein